MDALLEWGLDIVLALQSVRGLEGVMGAFTFLGNEEFFLFVMPVLYWCVSAGIGARLAVVLIASNGLNGLIKAALAQPRPYWLDARVTAFVTERSYGLPSGHAMNAVSVWGFLAAQLRRPWAWGATALVIALISVSRLYLGVHFPTDVAGGWLFGGLLLWLGLKFERPARVWLMRWSVAGQVALALALSLVYLGMSLLVLAVVPAPSALLQWAQTAAQAHPPETGERAIDPRGLESVMNTSGMILGLGAGLAMMARGARFDAGGSLAQRGLRFLIGVAGIAVLFLGLRALLPSGEGAPAYAFRYLRYALVVWWALYAAPWLFLKTRLARAA